MTKSGMTVDAIRAVVQEVLRNNIQGIDWTEERERYLGRIGVLCTARNYRYSLRRLESWCEQRGIGALDLSPASADDWITEERAADWAPATVCLDVTAASAFFTWLERRHAGLRNPFRGTRERPKYAPRRALAVPSPQEVETMVAAARPQTRAAIICMAMTGLRRGALPRLCIEAGVYQSISKGRHVRGTWPPEAARAVEDAGLDSCRPFTETTGESIGNRVRYLTEQLYKASRIDAIYSAHDLRHAFAIAHYQAHRDVYATSRALCHASVDMTAVYLRSLPGVDF